MAAPPVSPSLESASFLRPLHVMIEHYRTPPHCPYSLLPDLSLRSASFSARCSRISRLLASSASALRRSLASSRTLVSTRDISFSSPSPALSVGSNTYPCRIVTVCFLAGDGEGKRVLNTHTRMDFRYMWWYVCGWQVRGRCTAEESSKGFLISSEEKAWPIQQPLLLSPSLPALSTVRQSLFNLFSSLALQRIVEVEAQNLPCKVSETIRRGNGGNRTPTFALACRPDRRGMETSVL